MEPVIDPVGPLFTETEALRYIERAGEDPSVDFKQGCRWDGEGTSAGLTKDIMAMANSRGGGVIVIGIKEEPKGVPSKVGMPLDDCATFETTRVAAWVNSYCDPPITLRCAVVQRSNAHFVVIRVDEFDDLPVICKRDFVDPANTKKKLLGQGQIYTRTSNSESAPIQTPDAMRRLIGLATRKKSDELLAHVRSIIEGRVVAPQPSVEALFEKETTEVESALVQSDPKASSAVGWRVRAYPTAAHSPVFSDADLRSMTDEIVADRLPYFRLSRRNPQITDWGCFADGVYTFLAMTHAGLVVVHQPFEEDTEEHVNPYQSWNHETGNMDAPERLAKSKWFGFEMNLYRLCDYFRLLSAVAGRHQAGVSLRVEVRAQPLLNRILVDPRGHWVVFKHTCRTDRFTYSWTGTVEELRTDWKSACALTYCALLERFGVTEKPETILGWLNR